MFHDVIGPLLALLGTVLATLVGYRQWKRQQDSTRTAEFVAEREKAYKELWQKLEAVHLSVRLDTFQPEKFDGQVRAVNIHVIERALYLDQEVQRQVSDYMSALRNLGQLLKDANAKEAKKDAAITGAIAPDVLGRVQGLGEAYTAVDQRRNMLISNFKKVLSTRAG